MKAAIRVVLLLLALLPAGRAETLHLKLADYLTLDNSGLSLRPFEGYTLQPLPPLPEYTLEHAVTGERLQVHKPEEYFRYLQREAIFSGEAGRIVIASLRAPAPAAEQLPDSHPGYVEGRDFLEHLRQLDTTWDDASIDAWVSYYAGAGITWRSRHIKNFVLALPYTAYLFDNQQEHPGRMAFVMRLPDAEQGRRLVYIQFTFDRQDKIPNVNTAMAGLLASLRSAPRQHIRRVPARHYQAFADAAIRQEHLKTRADVIRNLRNLDNWWYTETPNYILVSDLAASERELVIRIQADVELLRGAFEQLVPPVREIRDVSVIRIFSRREDYLRFVPEIMAWSGGTWLPKQNELVVGPPAHQQWLGDRQRLLNIVYHEAFHQYLYCALDREPLPVWYDEGLAAMMEGIELDRRRQQARLLEVPHYRRLLFSLIDREQANLKQLLIVSDEDFYQLDRRRSYPLAWGLVYFLRKAAPMMPEQPYSGFCELIYREVTEEQASYRQVAELLAQTYDLDRLQADFEAFWQDRRARAAAEDYPLLRY